MTNSGGGLRDAGPPAFEIALAAVLWDIAKEWADDVAGGDLSHFVRATLSPRVAAAIEDACDQLTQRGALPECRAAALAALSRDTSGVGGRPTQEHPPVGQGDV